MTNTSAEWRSLAPKGMNAIAYPRKCGWHVIVATTGDTMRSVLNQTIIGKSCVPYRRPSEEPTAQDQLVALAIGVANVEQGAEETCHNL